MNFKDMDGGPFCLILVIFMIFNVYVFNETNFIVIKDILINHKLSVANLKPNRIATIYRKRSTCDVTCTF